MVYAALLPCPVIGGKVASFSAGKVETRPGVRKVVDIGEGVAVIADHYWVAQSALADLEVQWDEGPVGPSRHRLPSMPHWNARRPSRERWPSRSATRPRPWPRASRIEARHTCKCWRTQHWNRKTVWRSFRPGRQTCGRAISSPGGALAPPPRQPESSRHRFESTPRFLWRRTAAGSMLTTSPRRLRRKACARHAGETDLDARERHDARLLPSALPPPDARGGRWRPVAAFSSKMIFAVDYQPHAFQRRQGWPDPFMTEGLVDFTLRYPTSRTTYRDPRGRHARRLLAFGQQCAQCFCHRKLYRRAGACKPPGSGCVPDLGIASTNSRGSASCWNGRRRMRATPPKHRKGARLASPPCAVL